MSSEVNQIASATAFEMRQLLTSVQKKQCIPTTHKELTFWTNILDRPISVRLTVELSYPFVIDISEEENQTPSTDGDQT